MEVKELISHLNNTDECTWIEAKKGSAIDKSILETVNSFSNEPGLKGGYILLGVIQEEHSLFPSYVLTDIEDPDKLQLDLSSQCASMFNIPIRPEISVEMIDGKRVISIFVPELSEAQKPVYFKSEGLPRGAYRRIGSSDQRCTDDDLFVFYNNEDSFDSSIVQDSSLDDISEEAIELYRSLRGKVNAFAEELQYNDEDLLHSLGCIKKSRDQTYLTYAGLLLFGKRPAHRRLLPMVRVDYIRVPGNVWVEDPENRFVTTDMRGPLLEMVQRIFSQITDDLPKGFLLPEGELQAENIGLPSRVLREAIVNALIHRSYRENQPIQIIRYGNRLEIKNPGFSLKSEEFLGEPGSKNRNPYIAAVFHETNLAETKGSGIRSMRSLMIKAQLMPPNFESDHSRNQFTARLLLHHFLGVEDLKWLSTFKDFNLNENQKRALIFTKELGAIDNNSYRQLNTLDALHATHDLRDLRKKEILFQKGRAKGTYYIPGHNFSSNDVGNQLLDSAPVENRDITPVKDKHSTPVRKDHSAPVQNGDSTPVKSPDSDGFNHSAPVQKNHSAPVQKNYSTPLNDISESNAEPFDLNPKLDFGIKDALQQKINILGKRTVDTKSTEDIIKEICEKKYFTSSELAFILGKSEDYIKRKFLSPMISEKKLEYQFPEMKNHPKQAYKTVKDDSNVNT